MDVAFFTVKLDTAWWTAGGNPNHVWRRRDSGFREGALAKISSDDKI
jgi:hypothetical protein